MTPDELLAVMEEIAARWPDQEPWPPETIHRLSKDLHDYDASMIFEAIFSFVESGSKFRPSPSEIYRRVSEIAAREARFGQPALPDDPTKLRSITEWLEITYPDELVTWTEHLERIKDDQMKREGQEMRANFRPEAKRMDMTCMHRWGHIAKSGDDPAVVICVRCGYETDQRHADFDPHDDPTHAIAP